MSSENRLKPGIEERKGAAALAYNPDELAAPRVIAKGRGLLAEKILAEAKEHNIPIVEDKLLFRILYELELGTEIPLEIYEPVARILAFVYSVHSKRRPKQTYSTRKISGESVA